VTGAMISFHETMALTDEVITTRFIVGNFRAEFRIPVVAFTAGKMMSRS